MLLRKTCASAMKFTEQNLRESGENVLENGGNAAWHTKCIASAGT